MNTRNIYFRRAGLVLALLLLGGALNAQPTVQRFFNTVIQGTATIIEGNLVVGNGTPGVAVNGEDVYIEGTLEVDGAVDFGGAQSFSGAIGSTVTNAAGGSANPIDVTSALGIMNGSDTYHALDVNITNANHTGASNVVAGVDISSITGDTEATETAVLIGTGWDAGVNSGSPVVLDDGTTDSPTLTFQDATDETAVLSKADAGNLTVTTVAGDGLQVLTGNFSVGNGVPGVAINGEDAYVEGTFEVDGAAKLDGAVTVTSTTASGSCTLDGSSPSTCTATVTAATVCVCAPVGATAAIAAAGCAVGLSGTTLTVTSADTATNVVNYHCF